LAAMCADGLSSRDWNPELVRQVEADVQSGFGCDATFGLLLAYYLGVGDVVRARAMVIRMRNHSDGTRIAYAFLLAVVDRDGRAARALLDTVKSRAWRKTYQYWCALAAACDAAGDMPGARVAVESARQVAAKTRAPLDDDDRQLLDAIEQRASLQDAA
jgi:hypothetical protein